MCCMLRMETGDENSIEMWWNLISIFSHFFSPLVSPLGLYHHPHLSISALNKLTEREETNYDTLAHISHKRHFSLARSACDLQINTSLCKQYPRCMFWLIYMLEKCTQHTVFGRHCCFCASVVTRIGSARFFLARFPLPRSELVSIFT